MATEYILPNGDDSGWTTNNAATNCSSGINSGTPTDGSFIETTATEGDVIVIDLASVASVVDADTVTQVDIHVRAQSSNTSDGIDVELLIGGSPVGTTFSQASLATSFTNYTANGSTQGWTTDWTAAQLNGAQVRITSTQAGKPGACDIQVSEVEVEITYTPAASDVAFTTNAPDSFTLTENAASIDFDLSAGTDAFTLTEYAADVVATNELGRAATAEHFVTRVQRGRRLQTLVMPLGLQEATDVAFTANTDAFTLSEHQATITYDVEASGTTDAFTLSEHQATLTFDVEASATTDAFTLSEHQATVAYERNISANVDTFTLTENAASIDFDLAAGVDAFTLTENAATITHDVEVSATVDSFTLTENQATITYDVEVSAAVDAFTLTEYTALFSANISFTATTDAFALSEYSAGINFSSENSLSATAEQFVTRFQRGRRLQTLAMPPVAAGDVTFTANTDAFTLSEHQATITFDVGVSAGVDSFTLTEHVATVAYVPGGDVAFTANTDTFTLNEHAAGVSVQNDIDRAGTATPFVTHRIQGRRLLTPNNPLPFWDAERTPTPEQPITAQVLTGHNNRRIKWRLFEPEFFITSLIVAEKAEPPAFPDFFFEVTSKHSKIENKTNRSLLVPETLTYYEPPPPPGEPPVTAWRLAKAFLRTKPRQLRTPLELDEYPPTPLSGELNQSLGDFTVSSAGSVTVSGALDRSLDDFTVSSAATVDIVGTSTSALGSITISATGEVLVLGTAANTLDDFTLSSAAVSIVNGVATPTLDDFTVSAAGTVDVSGTATPTLGSFTIDAAGGVLVLAVGSITIDAFEVSGTGDILTHGSFAKSLDDFTLNGHGLVGPTPLDVADRPGIASRLDSVSVSADSVEPGIGSASTNRSVTSGTTSRGLSGGSTKRGFASTTETDES